jgi:glycerol-3-phosphate acyltransferase PlsY
MGVFTILIAGALSDSEVIVIAAGLAAMVGHNWSVFLKFRGGLGASIIQGVLAALVFWPFAIGAGLALISVRILRKTGISTFIWVAAVALVLLGQNLFFNHGNSPALILYPFVLLLPMLLKRFQVSGQVFKTLARTH